ncbi:hypothetical protein EMIT0P253_10469 [Pseudomonas sp. IT-P253]
MLDWSEALLSRTIWGYVISTEWILKASFTPSLRVTPE